MDHRSGPYDSAYVFSAEQQKELQKLCQKYLPQGGGKKAPSEEEEKMARLRKLDRSVTRAGTIAALLAGTGGAVVHGIGIAWIQGEALFTLGAVTAVAGLLLFLAAYPIYGFAAKKQHRRVEAQIRRLCRELMK